MGLLDKMTISGIRPKIKATNRGLLFQKQKPITPYNYPLSSITKYKICGYKKDGIFKRPFWITAEVATGRKLTPQAVGLDGFYTVEMISQSGLVSPRQERKEPLVYSTIPEAPEESDTFIYSNNIINDRGMINKNVKPK